MNKFDGWDTHEYLTKGEKLFDLIITTIAIIAGVIVMLAIISNIFVFLTNP